MGEIEKDLRTLKHKAKTIDKHIDEIEEGLFNHLDDILECVEHGKKFRIKN